MLTELIQISILSKQVHCQGVIDIECIEKKEKIYFYGMPIYGGYYVLYEPPRI